jgi:PAS domain S-box-containing protein
VSGAGRQRVGPAARASERTGPPVAPEDPLHGLILDSINEGVFTVDADFRITSLNAEAERIIGLPRERAVGRRCHDVFRANICGEGCALRQTIEDGRPRRNVRIEVLNDRLEPVPILVSTAVLRDRRGALIGGVEIFRDISELETLRREISGSVRFGDMVGTSPVMRALFATLPDVARSDAPVLLEGPSGAGKELVARAIHGLSGRSEGALVVVNCAALPDTLVESELFGHSRGAFTDARESRPGRFQAAHRGTLFLDEVGEISPAAQAKLLRALEEKEVTPLGASAAVKADARVIAATNRDLLTLVQEGRFREDLLYRLRVIPIRLPPLKERRGDIPLLVDHLLRRLRARTGKPAREVSAEALDLLCAHDFPGNVRELQNILERALVVCRDEVISVEHLPEEVFPRGARGAPRRLKPSEKRIAREARRSPPRPLSPEAARLVAALEANSWRRSRTAAALGIGRNTLWRRMKEYGLL